MAEIQDAGIRNFGAGSDSLDQYRTPHGPAIAAFVVGLISVIGIVPWDALMVYQLWPSFCPFIHFSKSGVCLTQDLCHGMQGWDSFLHWCVLSVWLPLFSWIIPFGNTE